MNKGSILIKNILLDNKKTNILIVDGKFRCLDACDGTEAETILEGEGKAILPSLYNTHTHSAMTIMRGYADDMALDKWLNDYIWPFEGKMTEEDFVRGNEIAAREMVESGTVFFNDMYFGIQESIDAVEKWGMRAAIGSVIMDNHPKAVTDQVIDLLKSWKDPTGGRIQFTMAPHAIYTVCAKRFKEVTELARNLGLRIHTHLAETTLEVENCLREHGMTPVKYLDSLGVLGPDVILAHCVHVTEEDADILAERQVFISHCPCSNMKLGSGVFPYERLIKAGCNITLGTDGASSGNNLDLREAMKFAALLAKTGGNTELLPAEQIFKWATVDGARAFGIDGGEIKEGKVADCILIDLNNVRMHPCYNLISNFVYSADSSCISKVICDGKVIK